jgi:rRNA-processing protein FCF1
MRINRGKAIRKYLRFYRIVYGLESPYHAILDGNFIYYALKFKVDIQDRLRVQLQVTGGEMVRLFITKSSLAELRAVPEGKTANAIAFATRFCEVLDDDDCGTVKDSTAAARLTELLWRAHRGWINGPQSVKHKGAGGSNTGPAPTHGFFVASQDVGLRRALAAIPGTPLVYLNNVAFVMEPPSEASKTFNKVHRTLPACLACRHFRP